MIEAIQQYCRETKQDVPETPAEICRCIFDSLALRYRQVFGWLKEFKNTSLTSVSDQGQSVALRTLSPLTSDIVLHVIGGGSLNKYLTQFTKASGDVSDIWAMRQIIANSVEMVPYHPAGDKAAWDKAYQRFLEVSGER